MAPTAHDPIRANLKFLADHATPLAYVASKGGGDRTEHLGEFESREVGVLDARTQLAATDLDREGFALLSHASAVQDFYDDEALRATYHAELVEIVTGATGARRVHVFDDTRRSSSLARQRERGIREPANIVHNDYSADSGPRRLADAFSAAPEEARELRKGRFAIINVWRPIAGPVVDQPLALCDAGTVRDDDLVPVERRSEERTGELQVVRYDPDQRWFYYPRMDRDEVLLFKTFDSMTDGRARFTPHSAFRHPDAADGAPPRESIESRCFVFF